MTYDYAICGGGILGLSVGRALAVRFPGARLVVLEKEPALAMHQTGHNSGVIHSGIYYTPGSQKARFAIEGSRLVPEFCRERGIPHDVCGKVIVATLEHELPRLEKLYQRGRENGLDVTMIGPEELREIEPHCAGRAAIRVPSTGIADYRAVAAAFAHDIQEQGGELRLGCRVEKIVKTAGGAVLETTTGSVEARFFISCSGLYSDRVARLDGVDPQARIVPFRGEYYELKPEKRYLVKHLIYPVPNPAFPFLGVHFTRMTDGGIHCGPNAVLALAREGYHKTDVSLRDLAETLGYRGFWKLAARNVGEGLRELYRSFSKKAFTGSLQRLIPEVQEADLVPAPAGVRAQALLPDGKIMDDFLIVRGDRSLHLCNAPSPAATACLAIGRAVAGQAPAPTSVAVGIVG
jgi:L-2-hydroxyglutarate oxidase